MLFADGKFHEIIFLKKYGTLYSLLEDLVTRKMTVNNANADQISFRINLMHGYNGCNFGNKACMDLEKGRSYYIGLAVANYLFLKY